jgi:hypothetical protein
LDVEKYSLHGPSFYSKTTDFGFSLGSLDLPTTKFDPVGNVLANADIYLNDPREQGQKSPLGALPSCLRKILEFCSAYFIPFS